MPFMAPSVMVDDDSCRGSTYSGYSESPVSSEGSVWAYRHDPYSGCDSFASSQEVKAVPRRGTFVVLVQFKFGRTGRFMADQFLNFGVRVLVQADRGEDMAVVVECEESTQKEAAAMYGKLQKVLRPAVQTEVIEWEKKQTALEAEAKEKAQQIINRRKIPMKIAHVEYQFDKKKLTFHFTSKAAHPKFRDILDELFSTWKCRIWFARYSRTAFDSECKQRLTESPASTPRSVLSSPPPSPSPASFLVVPSSTFLR